MWESACHTEPLLVKKVLDSGVWLDWVLSMRGENRSLSTELAVMVASEEQALASS